MTEFSRTLSLLRQERGVSQRTADYREGTALDTTVKDIIRKMAVTDRLWQENVRQCRSIGGDVLPYQVELF